jgi:hypothetical protein
MPIPANLPQLVKDLHAQYEARTGYTVALNMMRERQWAEWLVWSNYTWTVDDLARVIAYLRRKIDKGERNDGALKFGNLIGQPDHFEEDLNLAREEAAKSPFKPKTRPRPLPEGRDSIDEPEAEVLSPEEAARRWKEQFKA